MVVLARPSNHPCPQSTTHLEHGPRRGDVSVVVVLDGVAEERLLVHRLPVRERRHVHGRQHVRVIRHRGLYRVWCEIDWSSGRWGGRAKTHTLVRPGEAQEPMAIPRQRQIERKPATGEVVGWPYKRGGTSRPQSKRRVRLPQRPPSPGRRRPFIGRGEAGRAGFVLVVSRNI